MMNAAIDYGAKKERKGRKSSSLTVSLPYDAGSSGEILSRKRRSQSPSVVSAVSPKTYKSDISGLFDIRTTKFFSKWRGALSQRRKSGSVSSSAVTKRARRNLLDHTGMQTGAEGKVSSQTAAIPSTERQGKGNIITMDISEAQGSMFLGIGSEFSAQAVKNGRMLARDVERPLPGTRESSQRTGCKRSCTENRIRLSELICLDESSTDSNGTVESLDDSLSRDRTATECPASKPFQRSVVSLQTSYTKTAVEKPLYRVTTEAATMPQCFPIKVPTEMFQLSDGLKSSKAVRVKELTKDISASKLELEESFFESPRCLIVPLSLYSTSNRLAKSDDPKSSTFPNKLEKSASFQCPSKWPEKSAALVDVVANAELKRNNDDSSRPYSEVVAKLLAYKKFSDVASLCPLKTVDESVSTTGKVVQQTHTAVPCSSKTKGGIVVKNHYPVPLRSCSINLCRYSSSKAVFTGVCCKMKKKHLKNVDKFDCAMEKPSEQYENVGTSSNDSGTTLITYLSEDVKRKLPKRLPRTESEMGKDYGIKKSPRCHVDRKEKQTAHVDDDTPQSFQLSAKTGRPAMAALVMPLVENAEPGDLPKANMEVLTKDSGNTLLADYAEADPLLHSISNESAKSDGGTAQIASSKTLQLANINKSTSSSANVLPISDAGVIRTTGPSMLMANSGWLDTKDSSRLLSDSAELMKTNTSALPVNSPSATEHGKTAMEGGYLYSKREENKVNGVMSEVKELVENVMTDEATEKKDKMTSEKNYAEGDIVMSEGMEMEKVVVSDAKVVGTDFVVSKAGDVAKSEVEEVEVDAVNVAKEEECEIYATDNEAKTNNSDDLLHQESSSLRDDNSQENEMKTTEKGSTELSCKIAELKTNEDTDSDCTEFIEDGMEAEEFDSGESENSSTKRHYKMESSAVVLSRCDEFSQPQLVIDLLEERENEMVYPTRSKKRSVPHHEGIRTRGKKSSYTQFFRDEFKCWRESKKEKLFFMEDSNSMLPKQSEEKTVELLCMSVQCKPCRVELIDFRKLLLTILARYKPVICDSAGENISDSSRVDERNCISTTAEKLDQSAIGKDPFSLDESSLPSAAKIISGSDFSAWAMEGLLSLHEQTRRKCDISTRTAKKKKVPTATLR